MPYIEQLFLDHGKYNHVKDADSVELDRMTMMYLLHKWFTSDSHGIPLRQTRYYELGLTCHHIMQYQNLWVN